MRVFAFSNAISVVPFVVSGGGCNSLVFNSLYLTFANPERISRGSSCLQDFLQVVAQFLPGGIVPDFEKRSGFGLHLVEAMFANPKSVESIFIQK
jgi:hypothetical protein